MSSRVTTWAGLLQQELEELQRLALETVLRPIPGEHSALEVDFKFAEADHRRMIYGGMSG